MNPTPSKTRPRTWLETVRPKVPALLSSAALETAQKHCILLHGWHATSSSMLATENAMRQLPTASGWRFWRVTYDTHWKSFRRTARDIAEALRRLNHEFSDSILVGYSMGGLVARQMAADGFPCRAVVAICSPHHGYLPWLPVLGRGGMSLAGWGPAMRALNSNPRDIALRHQLHCFAITYADRLGRHQHDGIVERSSALGAGLGPIAWRREVRLRYPWLPVPYYDPHWCGMLPHTITPVLELCGELLGQG